MDKQNLKIGIIMLVLVSLNVGCTAINTFPKAARPGETVALSVGSADNLTKANINTVTFTSENQCCTTPIDITNNVRSVFRLYADKTSQIYEEPGPGTNVLISTALHEPWVSIIAIDLPEEYSPGVPLPEGPATLTINTPTNEVTYPTIGYHINDTSIAIEILPEANPTDAQANTFEYEFGTCCTLNGNLSQLEPRPHVLIRSEYAEDPSNLSSYAAIEMQVDFTGTTSTPITNDNVKIVVDDMTAYTGSNMNYITSVKNEMLTVILISLKEQLKPYEMRFAAVLEDANTFTGTPSISATEFYDLNGKILSDSTLFIAEVR